MTAPAEITNIHGLKDALVNGIHAYCNGNNDLLIDILLLMLPTQESDDGKKAMAGQWAQKIGTEVVTLMVELSHLNPKKANIELGLPGNEPMYVLSLALMGIPSTYGEFTISSLSIDVSK